MIKTIELTNFKCFKETTKFNFSKLNLLTGINGRGKSSVLQSILILAQSAKNKDDLSKLVINDTLIQLGNFDDVKNSDTPRSENISLRFKFADTTMDELHLEYEENLDDPLLADFAAAEVTLPSEKITYDEDDKNREQLEIFADTIKKTHFVSADRLGPVRYVDKSNLPAFNHVGPRGEYTINILADSINLPNVNEALYRGVESMSLIQQTMEWLDYILEGAKITIRGREKESSVLYMLINNKNNSHEYKPANVGFGYSYILPLIVTGLVARPGEVVIVENPEAHLHPRAQTKIAEFFARVASTGVQVFIESHSEHILNGMRVSSLRSDIAIKHNDLAIHYFNESFGSEELEVTDKGKISNWPSGFFDQQEIDLAEIFKHSR